MNAAATSTSEFDQHVLVRRIRYVSDATGWAVVDAVAADGGETVLVGALSHVEERERVHVLGSWELDSRYGPQVKVRQATPLPPQDADAVVAYLRRVKHVGPTRALKLVERFGATGALQAIDRDPGAALRTAGLRRRALSEATASWEGLRATRRLHLLLAPHGLAYLVARLHETYGDDAHRAVRERPYELTCVFGVGFATADRIARGLGRSADEPERARAAVVHLLSEAERSGSTCMPRQTLLSQARTLLGSPVADGLLEQMAAEEELAREGEWIYRRHTAELEAELAQRVLGLLRRDPSEKFEDPGRRAALADLELNSEQLAGVRNAFTSRLSLITGGPGTGKTTSIRAIAALAASQGARVLLAAPTGRAAVRMSEASGFAAKTVHAALGWIPGEGPVHDEHDPVPCEMLIVDETSMANLELLVTLLRAVGPQTHVVLVGDADQLAPVGAGKPFAELIESGALASARLQHIFRQAAGSMIVQGAHAIRRGLPPSFRPAEGMRRDLFLVAHEDPLQARRDIVSLVCHRLPGHYQLDPVEDIQVFAPVYRGELGIDALNEALRQELNPHGRAVRGGRLRIGDKLMMTGRNLHELGLMNGTLLRLIDEIGQEDGDDAALLLGSEGTVFRVPIEQAERLRLAYACSVHRGQGIELPVAVIVAHPAAGAFFLRREMLYTAITRARLATVIVGTPQVVARAARRPDTGRRHSRLGERLGELMQS